MTGASLPASQPGPGQDLATNSFIPSTGQPPGLRSGSAGVSSASSFEGLPKSCQRGAHEPAEERMAMRLGQ